MAAALSAAAFAQAEAEAAAATAAAAAAAAEAGGDGGDAEGAGEGGAVALAAPKLKVPEPSVLRTCPSDPSLVGNKNPFRLIFPVPAGSRFISSLLLVDITLLSTNFNPSVVKLSTSTLALTVKSPVIAPLPVPVNALIVGFVSVLFVSVTLFASVAKLSL